MEVEWLNGCLDNGHVTSETTIGKVILTRIGWFSNKIVVTHQ